MNVSIYDNYVHQNGRVGIMWQSNDGLASQSGSDDLTPPLGTSVALYGNHVEVEAGTTLWSVTGTKVAGGSDTNENRGYDQSGTSDSAGNSGTHFESNTANVNSQKIPGSDCGSGPSGYLTVDGEGILQQIQDGEVAERNVWKNNDLSFGTKGPMALYALHSVVDMIITGNKVNANEKIGIFPGGSTPPNGTLIRNLECSDNIPPAICH